MHYLNLVATAFLVGVICGPINITPDIEARQTYDDNTIACPDYRRTLGPSKRNGGHDEMVAYPDYKRHTKAKSGKTEGLPVFVRRQILLNESESGNVDIVAYPDYRRGPERSA